jgi:hypothetical protein
LFKEDQTNDAFCRYVELFERLQAVGLCKERVLPPPEVVLEDMAQVVAWIKETHGTVYHWSATCKAGINGSGAESLSK